MAKESQANTPSSLSNFQFDNDNTFFGISTQSDSPIDTTIKEIKKPSSIEESDDDTDETPVSIDDTDKDDDKVEEEDTDDFFGTGKKEKSKTIPSKDKDVEVNVTAKVEEDEVESEDDSEEEDSDKTEQTDDKEFFSTLAKEMKENGVFQNVEIKEDEEINQDKFFELQDQEIEARVNETLESFFEELDEDGKAFLKFKKNGGRTVDFFSRYGSNTSIDFENFDIKDKEQREKLLRYYIATVEQLEGGDIDDRLEWLKESGKEENYANKWFSALKDSDEKQKQELIKEQEMAEQEAEKRNKKFNQELVDISTATEQVGVFPLSKTDQKELPEYITKPKVKVGKNKYVPEFQVGLANILKADTAESKQKLLLLAKLIKEDFNVKDLAKKTETIVTKKVKSRLEEAKRGVKLKSSGGAGKKQLSDFF